jgi:hypothetical protein
MFISRIYSDANPPATDDESATLCRRIEALAQRPNRPALDLCMVHVSPKFGLLTQRELADHLVDHQLRTTQLGISKQQRNVPPAVPNRRYLRVLTSQ